MEGKPKARGRARGRGRGERGRGRAQREEETPRPGARDQPGEPGPPRGAGPQPPAASGGPPPPWGPGPQPPAASGGPPPPWGPGPQPPAASGGPPPPWGPRPQPPAASGGPPPPWGPGPQPPAASGGPPPPWGPGPQPPAASGGGDQGASGGSGIIGSGRAVRRGTSRAQDSRPGDQGAEEVAEGVGNIALQGEAGAEAAAQERRENRYAQLVFRDPSLPKKGTKGTAVTLRGNFFKMRTPRQWTIYQYHVDYMPPCESTKLRKALLYTHDNIVGPVKAFDGMILFLPHRLPNDETVVHSFTREENRQIKITIKFTCQVVDVTPSTIQLMNIIWRRFLGMMKMKQINRHFFNMENRIQVPEHKLEVIPGFQTSILRYESDILLDMDITHKLLRTLTVFDQIAELSRRFGGRSNEFFQQAYKDIVGTVVLTRYNNKTYTVSDISWDGRVTDQFERHNNMISYEDYYRRQYDVHIRNRNQPLLVTRAKARDRRRGEAGNIFLVPELCVVTGLTEANKSDMKLKKDLGFHTRIEPSKRVARLTGFMRDLHGNQKVVDELAGWGLTLEDNLVSIPARRLNPEDIWMMERGTKTKLTYKPEQADWSLDMREKTMKSSVRLVNWTIIFPKRSSGHARSLCDTIRRAGPPMGMQIEQPTPRELTQDRASDYVAELRRCVVEGETQMVVCLLPNNRKDRYDGIKKFCCTERPVPSQAVLNRTIEKAGPRLLSVATKIAIQMNCKLGGSPWFVNIPMKGAMIIGFDTYHDSSQRGRSVGGVVATLNNEYDRYYSTTTFQTSHMELLNQLGSCVTECVRAYEKRNGSPPSRVIVFRDGVGDGQLNLVYQHEVPQVKAAVGGAQLAFIVVKKRSIARFFEEGGGHAGDGAGRGARGGGPRSTFSNPGPGTVIDDVATKPAWFDFFLISQSVREGTVTPTHYNVLMNECKFLPDVYQQMSYKLTHMYYNWQGTIRVPAPCMYAHKLAYLVGQSLHVHPHVSLADKLYYL